METVVIVVGLITLAVVVVLMAVILGDRNKPRQPDQAVLMLQEQLTALQSRFDGFGETVATTLRQSTSSMNVRLDRAAEVVGDLREKIGQIHEVGQAAAELVNIMRAPKLRGGMGELFLGDLLAQILPREHFVLQHKFKSGDTVDAAIRLGDKVVPVDAKFPLENFKRSIASAPETEQAAARRQFLRDVKKHVDAIASKYILPDEGTYEFALMYVPAENVYYETIIREEGAAEGHQLFSYAIQKRVVPVSPNSFYAYLQTILLGLRGMRVEERAHEILDALGRLRGDFDKFQENFRLVGRHLTNASNSFAEADRSVVKFSDKLSLIEQPPPNGQGE
jgi:DNA recombination protein RmuC